MLLKTKLIQSSAYAKFLQKNKTDFWNIKKFAVFIMAMDIWCQCSKNFTARRYNLSNGKCWILFLKVVSCSRDVVSLFLYYKIFWCDGRFHHLGHAHVDTRYLFFCFYIGFYTNFDMQFALIYFFVCFRILKIFAECSVKRMKIYLLDYKLLPFTFCKRWRWISCL